MEKQNVLISVIIPVYNTEKYLPKCLDSVLNQNNKNIEIIVVNDCSPNNCNEIVNDYIKRYDNIKLIVLDENDNENIYEIIITDYPAIVSIIIDMLATIITAGIFLSPIVIILIIKNKKKNKRSNNVQHAQLIDDTVKKENQNNKNYETR